MKNKIKIQIMNNKKVFLFEILFFIIIVFSLSFVSADLTKSVSNDVITLKNCVGIWNGINCVLGTDILTQTKVADLRLNTPIVYNVIRGKDRLVAEFNINSYVDDLKTFGKVSFYSTDLKRYIQRDYKYKVKVFTPYSVDVPDEIKNVCETINLTEICHNDIISYKKLTRYNINWNDLDSSQNLKGNYTIGLFTDVYPNEQVEFIPILYDTKITEWASWNETFTNGLVSYWKLDNNGDARDEMQINKTLKAYGSPIFNTTSCKIGNCYYFNGTNYFSNDSTKTSSGYPLNSDSFTYNTWFKLTSEATVKMAFCYGTGSGGHYYFRNYFQNTLIDAGRGGVAEVSVTNSTLFDDNWHMLTVKVNSSNINMYTDGQWKSSVTNALQTQLGGITIAGALYCGGGSPFIGFLDELSFWNRSLSDSEIFAIYNNGNGMTYSNDNNYPQFNNSNYYPFNGTEYNENYILYYNTTVTFTNGTVIMAVSNDLSSWTNYYLRNLSNIYYGNLTGLTPNTTDGRYYLSFASWGNGTNNLYNSTDIYSYFVIKNSSYNLSLIYTNQTIYYGSPTNVSNNSCPSQIICKLYRNSTLLNSSDLNILSAGIYNYTFNSSGNANYSAKSVSYNIQVNKSNDNCSVMFNVSNPSYYPTIFKVYGNCSSPFYLMRNGTIILNNSQQDLSAGVYNFSIFRNDTQNYSIIYSQTNFSMLKPNASISLYIDGVQSDRTVYYKNANFTITTLLNVGIGNVSLYINNILVNNSINPSKFYNFSVGLNNITANISSNSNYSEFSVTYYINVNYINYNAGYTFFRIKSDLSAVGYSNQCGTNLSVYKYLTESGCGTYDGAECNTSMFSNSYQYELLDSYFNYSTPNWAYNNVSCLFKQSDPFTGETRFYLAWRVSGSNGQFCTVTNKWDWYVYDYSANTTFDNTYYQLDDPNYKDYPCVTNSTVYNNASLTVDFSKPIYMIILILVFITVVLLVLFGFPIYAGIITILTSLVLMFSGIVWIVAFPVFLVGVILLFIPEDFNLLRFLGRAKV